MGARIVEASGVPLSLILSDLIAHQGTLSQAKEKDTPQHEVKPKLKSSGALALYSRDMTANADKLRSCPEKLLSLPCQNVNAKYFYFLHIVHLFKICDYFHQK